LFNQLPEEKTPPKRQLILGRAGIGKSTLCQYMAYCWALGSEENKANEGSGKSKDNKENKESKESKNNDKNKVIPLWKNRFSAVFWVPLRELLNYPVKEDKTAQEYSTEIEFILLWLLRKYSYQTRFQDFTAEVILNYLRQHQGKILFVLDGLDEVAHHLEKPTPTGKTLTTLLAQGNWIATSRPDLVRPFIKSNRVDRTLENIGFSNQQIQQYIQGYFNAHGNPSLAENLFSMLRQNTSIWGIAHIPINLTLVCGIYYQDAKKRRMRESKENENMPLTSIQTMTALYVRMVEALMDRYAEKQEPGSLDLASSTTEKRNALLLPFFQRLAFIQLHKNKGLIIEAKDMNETFKMVWIQQAKTMQQQFLQFIGVQGNVTITDHGTLNIHINGKGVLTPEDIDKLCDQTFQKIRKAGFLKATGDTLHLPEKNRDYYFLHFTFQEYFAASYLVEALKNPHTVEYKEALDFIGLEKYNPRYGLVLGFMSGLLSSNKVDDKPLKAFWHALLTQRDLSALGHVRLIFLCLEEAGDDKRIPYYEGLLKQLNAWLHTILFTRPSTFKRDPLLLQYMQNTPRLLRRTNFLDDVNNFLCKPYDSNNMYEMQSYIESIGMLGRAAATDKIVNSLMKILNIENDKIEKMVSSQAAETLGLIEPFALKDGIKTVLLNAAGESYFSVGCNAVTTIKLLWPDVSNHITPLLVKNLTEKDKRKEKAIEALYNLGSAAVTPEAVAALLDIAQKDTGVIRRQAIHALGSILRQSTLRDAIASTLSVLCSMLKEQEQNDTIINFEKFSIINALGDIGTAANSVPAELIPLLLKFLTNATDPTNKSIIIEALGKLGRVAANPEVIWLLIKFLKDYDYKAILPTRLHSELVRTLVSLAPFIESSEIRTSITAALVEATRKGAIEAWEHLDVLKFDKETACVLFDEALTHTNESMRLVAVEKVAQLELIDASKVRPFLLKALELEAYNDTKSRIIKAIGELGRVTATSEIIGGLLKILYENNSLNSLEHDVFQALLNLAQFAELQDQQLIVKTYKHLLEHSSNKNTELGSLIMLSNFSLVTISWAEGFFPLDKLLKHNFYYYATTIEALAQHYFKEPLSPSAAQYVIICALHRGVPLVLQTEGVVIYEGGHTIVVPYSHKDAKSKIQTLINASNEKATKHGLPTYSALLDQFPTENSVVKIANNYCRFFPDYFSTDDIINHQQSNDTTLLTTTSYRT
jgi:HEAT repeat protein